MDAQLKTWSGSFYAIQPKNDSCPFYSSQELHQQRLHKPEIKTRYVQFPFSRECHNCPDKPGTFCSLRILLLQTVKSFFYLFHRTN